MAAVSSLLLALVRSGIDLTPRQMCVLLSCRDCARTVKEISEILHVDRYVVTRAVDRLVELECATREENPKDRRSILVRLTETGLKWCVEIDSINPSSKHLRTALFDY